jgi:hypothetical protein
VVPVPLRGAVRRRARAARRGAGHAGRGVVQRHPGRHLRRHVHPARGRRHGAARRQRARHPVPRPRTGGAGPPPPRPLAQPDRRPPAPPLAAHDVPRADARVGPRRRTGRALAAALARPPRPAARPRAGRAGHLRRGRRIGGTAGASCRRADRRRDGSGGRGRRRARRTGRRRCGGGRGDGAAPERRALVAPHPRRPAPLRRLPRGGRRGRPPGPGRLPHDRPRRRRRRLHARGQRPAGVRPGRVLGAPRRGVPHRRAGRGAGDARAGPRRGHEHGARPRHDGLGGRRVLGPLRRARDAGVAGLHVRQPRPARRRGVAGRRGRRAAGPARRAAGPPGAGRGLRRQRGRAAGRDGRAAGRGARHAAVRGPRAEGPRRARPRRAVRAVQPHRRRPAVPHLDRRGALLRRRRLPPAARRRPPGRRPLRVRVPRLRQPARAGRRGGRLRHRRGGRPPPGLEAGGAPGQRRAVGLRGRAGPLRGHAVRGGPDGGPLRRSRAVPRPRPGGGDRGGGARVHRVAAAGVELRRRSRAAAP